MTGAAFGFVGRGIKLGANQLGSLALDGSGLATSGNLSLIARWSLGRSAAISDLKPLVVQGIKVGMVGTQSLSTEAVALGVVTNIVTGAVVSGGYYGGTWLGSLAVGFYRCNY